MSIEDIPLGSVVRVSWWDSERVNLGWDEREAYSAALRDRVLYESVGALIDMTSEGILLVMNTSPRGLVGNGMVIPKAAIVAVKVLDRHPIFHAATIGSSSNVADAVADVRRFGSQAAVSRLSPAGRLAGMTDAMRRVLEGGDRDEDDRRPQPGSDDE